MIQLVHYWKCINVRKAREGEKESGQEERVIEKGENK